MGDMVSPWLWGGIGKKNQKVRLLMGTTSPWLLTVGALTGQHKGA